MYKNGPSPASSSFIFCLFKQTIHFLQRNKCEKCPSSIWSWDSIPQPLEHESSPITTRPGLMVEIGTKCMVTILMRRIQYTGDEDDRHGNKRLKSNCFQELVARKQSQALTSVSPVNAFFISGSL